MVLSFSYRCCLLAVENFTTKMGFALGDFWRDSSGVVVRMLDI